MALQQAKGRTDFRSDLGGVQPTSFTNAPASQHDISGLIGLSGQIEQSATDMFANSIELAGQAIEQGITNFALHDLEEKQWANVNDYLESRLNPERAREASENAVGLEMAEHALWNKLGEGATIDDINVISGAYDREVNKYKRAMEQGVMSRAEFEAKVLATTRESIRRTPGLSDQLIRHSEKVLGLSGVRSIEDPVDPIEKMKEAVYKEAVKRKVPFDMLNPDYDQLVTTLTAMNREFQDFSALEQAHKNNNIMSKEQARTFARHGANVVVNGGMTGFLEATQNKFSTMEYPKAAVEIRNLAIVEKARVANMLRAQGILDESEGQEILKNYSQNIDDMVASLDRFNSGQDAMDFMQTRANFMRHRQDANLMERVDVASINLIKGLDPFMVGWAQKDPKNEQTAWNLISDLVNNAWQNPTVTRGFTSNNFENLAKDNTVLFQKSLSMAGPEEIVKMSGTLVKGVNELNAKSPVDAVKFMDSHLITLGNRETKELIKDKTIPASVISDLTSMSDHYLRQVFNVKQTILDEQRKSLGALVGLSKPSEVSAQLLRDGRLIYTSSDPDIQTRLNSEIAQRYNMAIEAIATLSDMTTLEASRMMYPRMQGMFDIENNAFQKEFGEPVFDKMNRQEVTNFATQEAQKVGLDPRLVMAVIQQESGFKQDAVSSAGARGLMQLMPATAEELGVNPNNPQDNIRGGIRYLKQMIDQFGSIELGLAAYNAGPGNVQKHGGIPPFKETQDYVNNIMSRIGGS